MFSRLVSILRKEFFHILYDKRNPAMKGIENNSNLLTIEQTDALKVIFERVPPQKVDWCLSGSASLRVQGMDVHVHDLDIQVNHDHIFQVEKALSKYMVSPVGVFETGDIRSLDGKAIINGIEVELIADMQVKDGSGAWQNIVDMERKKWIDWQGLKLPVIPLQVEAQIYEKLGRKEKIDMIKNFLKTEEEIRND
jgi:hypothetical protein